MAKITVELLGSFGTDLDVVNAARVSYDKESNWLTSENGETLFPPTLKQADKDLIEYLATGLRKKERRLIVDRMMEAGIKYANGEIEANAAFGIANKLIDEIQAIQKHWAPFTHCFAKFRICCPIFVARQFHRSGVGFSPPLADDFGYSEESRRYVDQPPEFYDFDSWRSRNPDLKQGSGGDHADQLTANELAGETNEEAAANYAFLIGRNYAPEQIRSILPMSLMTKFIWTGSLYAWANLCRQRIDTHTQHETRTLALQVSEHMGNLFPVSWAALIRS